jgi:hypothetical protein
MKYLHYTFSVEYAEKYGINEAIMLHNFIYWINMNKANNKNYINGKYWTYNSSKAFIELFPFWTQKQIEYTISKLIEKKALIKDCFNEDKRDRTAWYTLSDNFFSDCISENSENKLTNLGNDILQNSEMYKTTNKKQQIKNTNKNNIKKENLSLSENPQEVLNRIIERESKKEIREGLTNIFLKTIDNESLKASSMEEVNATKEKLEDFCLFLKENISNLDPDDLLNLNTYFVLRKEKHKNKISNTFGALRANLSRASKMKQQNSLLNGYYILIKQVSGTSNVISQEFAHDIIQEIQDKNIKSLKVWQEINPNYYKAEKYIK